MHAVGSQRACHWIPAGMLPQVTGVAEQTVVFFASDNGAHNEGGHNVHFFDSTGGLRGFKRSYYEVWDLTATTPTVVHRRAGGSLMSWGMGSLMSWGMGSCSDPAPILALSAIRFPLAVTAGRRALSVPRSLAWRHAAGIRIPHALGVLGCPPYQ